jgi:hypothetical protein
VRVVTSQERDDATDRTGKWCASFDEERFTSGEYFDTRAEAEAYGREVLAPEDGREHDSWFGLHRFRKLPPQRSPKR